MYFRILIIVVGLCQLAVAEPEIELENPVRGAKEDEINVLPEFEKTEFKQFSGYLKARDGPKPHEKKFLHYWLVEAAANSESGYKNGLFLWLNGGPGCSSMSNLLRGNGPFTINSQGKPVTNPYSFNHVGNVLYIDSPVGAGFSYSPKGHLDSDDESAAEDLLNALRSFYTKFPHYREKALVLAGESYAAVYLTLLADKIIEKEPKIDLTTIFIGNGYTDAKRLGESFVFYSYYHGLIDTAGWRDIATYCCDGNTPDHKKCHFAATSVKCLNYLKTLSNYVTDPKPGLNPQNIFDESYNPPRLDPTVQVPISEMSNDPGPSSPQRNSRLAVDRNNIGCFKQPNQEIVTNKLFTNSLKALTGDNSTDNFNHVKPSSLYCANADFSIYHETYMNRKDVKEALHIPERLQKPFKQCSREIFLSHKQVVPFQKGGIEPVLIKVLKSNDKMKLIMINGDSDLVANFIGNDWFSEELGYPVSQPHSPLVVNNSVVGFAKFYNDRIVYATLKGVGHSPITEKPNLVYSIIKYGFNFD